MQFRLALPALFVLTLIGAGLAAAVTTPAAAQTGVSDTFKGFGSNTKEPIQIEADSLDVRDKDAAAMFSGNVQVRQKDTTLKTARLKVFYEGQAGAAIGAGAGAQANAGQQIRRFETDGKMLITQAPTAGDNKSQTVTGDSGWFDMAKQKAQVNGNVILTQGTNVARGDRLDIDMKTGEYRLSGGRIQLILEPSKDAGPAAAAKPKH